MEERKAEYGNKYPGKAPKSQIGAPKDHFPGDTVINNGQGFNEPFGGTTGIESPPGARGEDRGPVAPSGTGIPIQPIGPTGPSVDDTERKKNLPPQYKVSFSISRRPTEEREVSKETSKRVPDDLRKRYDDLGRRIREIVSAINFDALDVYKYTNTPPREWVDRERESVSADWDDEKSWSTYASRLSHDQIADIMEWDEITAMVAAPSTYQKYVEAASGDPFDFWFRRKKPPISDDSSLVSRVRRRLRTTPESDTAKAYSEYWRKRNMGKSMKSAYHTAKEKWLQHVKENGGEFIDPKYKPAMESLKKALDGYVPTEEILAALETVPTGDDRIRQLRDEYESILKEGVHALDITAGIVAREDRLYGRVRDAGFVMIPVRRIAGEYTLDDPGLEGVDWSKTFDEQFLPAVEQVEQVIEDPTPEDVNEVVQPSNEDSERFVIADDLIDVAMTVGESSIISHAQRMAEILPEGYNPRYALPRIDPEEARARLKSRRGIELPAPGVFQSEGYQKIYAQAPMLPLDPRDPSSVDKCLEILQKKPGAMVAYPKGQVNEPSQYYRLPTRFGDKKIDHVVNAAWFALFSANTAVESEEVQFVVWQSGQESSDPGKPGLMSRKPKIIELLKFLKWAGFPTFDNLYSILKGFSPKDEDYEERLLALTRLEGFQAKVASFFLALLGDKRSPTLDMHAHGYLIEKGKIELPPGKYWTPIQQIQALDSKKETKKEAQRLAKQNKDTIAWVTRQYAIRTKKEAPTDSKKSLEAEKKRIRLYMQRQMAGWNGSTDEFWGWYASNQFFDTHEPRRDMIHSVFFQSLFPELFTPEQLAKRDGLYRDYKENLEELRKIQPITPNFAPLAVYRYGDRYFLRAETSRNIGALQMLREQGVSYIQAHVAEIIPGSSIPRKQPNREVWEQKTRALRMALQEIAEGHSREAVFTKYGGEYGPGLARAVNDYLWLRENGQEHCGTFVEQTSDGCGGCTFNPNGGGTEEYGYGYGSCLLSEHFLNVPERGFGKLPPETYSQSVPGTPRTQRPK